jgi:hypothetical protein
MQDIDTMIDEALDAEERQLLRSIEEPGFLAQAFGLFGGRTGWVTWVLMVTQGVLFLAGAWTAWRFFGAADPVTQLRWGLPATVLLLTATILKMALMPRLESNRLLLELKRLELQIARGASR